MQWQEACFLGSSHDMIKNPVLLLGQIRKLLSIPAIRSLQCMHKGLWTWQTNNNSTVKKVTHVLEFVSWYS